MAQAHQINNIKPSARESPGKQVGLLRIMHPRIKQLHYTTCANLRAVGLILILPTFSGVFMLEKFCSEKNQKDIVSALGVGDEPMANSLYQLCRENIQQDNENFIKYRQLQKQFSDEGISKDEWAQMDTHKEKADREVKALNLDLLITLKKQQDPSGVCTIDFSDSGDIYKGDGEITCKKGRK